MKYRYRFKNPRIEKAVFALFDENSIKAAIDRQMNNDSNIISLANCWPKENKTKIHEELQENIGLIGRIDFAKSELEVIPDYDPNGWNPYPEVEPPRDGWYLVQWKKGPEGCGDEFPLGVSYWDKDETWTGIEAFRSLPATYLGEETKEEVKDEDI